jgi:hypothetical protein
LLFTWNNRYDEQEQNHTLEILAEETRVKFSLKWLFGAVTATAFFIWLVLGIIHTLTHVESGENVASVSWLPKSATNVSYYKSYSRTAYEFEIAEAEFVKWRDWELRPIDGAISIPRYIRTRVPDFGPNPTTKEREIRVEAYESRTARVANGLYYTYRQRNGGGVIVAYDRDRGKAFFWSSPR